MGDGSKYLTDPSPMEVLEWVLHQMEEVSKTVGISFEGFENEALELFAAIEKKWRDKMT